MNRIATAGDSGNDRDMLLGQTCGIVVANYSQELEPLRKSKSHQVYFAKARYAGGVIEGLEHYGFGSNRSGKPAKSRVQTAASAK